MAESLRDLVVSLSLNTDNFTRNINSVNKQIREAESYFKLASAGVKGFDTSAAGLSAKVEMLQRKLQLQKDAVGQYERALTAASAKLQECYIRQEDYAQRLADAKAKQADLRAEVENATANYERYRDSLGESDSATIAAKANMEAFQQELKDADAEVEKLSGQNDALKRSTQNAADAVSTAQTQLNRANAALRETEAELSETNRQLRTAQSAWTAAGKALTEFGDRCQKIGKSAEQLGKTLTRTVTTPIVGLGTAAVKASLDFESSFAYVRKTVNGTEADFDTLAAASKRMSTEIATSTDEINKVMATGGQLGIATEHIEEFARVMIDLSNASTDLDADTAATQLAKFANIMGISQSQFSNIGSTIAMLGNNFATTEAPIAEMAMRIAGAGKQVGLTEAQVLGLATALSSVGIQAQAGGSSISKALINMEVAATTGGDALTDFARACGITEKQFVEQWKSDPIRVFQLFIERLSQMSDEGISAVATLDEIGISEIRLRDTMLRAVNATELFANAQDMAAQAWEENTALADKANVRYNTTASKLTNLKNKAVLFAQTLGDDLRPTLDKIIEGVNGFIDKLGGLDSAQRQQIIRIAAIAAATGPLILAFGKVTRVIGTVSKGIGAFATAVGAAGGGFSGFLSVLGKSPAVWAAVAVAVIAGTVALADYVSGAKAAREALKGMEETAKSWKETAADTFYGSSKGLSFFGMSTEDFVKSGEDVRQTSAQWLSGLITVWTDGKKETNAIVKEWTDSWKNLTAETRTGLESLKATADAHGYTGLSAQMQTDLDALDAMDAEIGRLLKKRQSRNFTDADRVRLQELVDARDAIAIKYKLVPEGGSEAEGFETIRKKVNAEIARAQARGQEVSTEVYENAVVASAEGLAALNAELDEQYKNSSGTWTDYPTTADNANITSPTLVVKPTHAIWVGETATLRITTSDASIGDTTSIYKVQDGSPGGQGTDASIVFLTNENITYAGTKDGKVAANTKTCNVVAYTGTTKVTPTVGTPTGMPTGMTITVGAAVNDEVPLTIAVAANSTLGAAGQLNGVVNVPVTSPVETTLQIQWSKVNTGATGAGTYVLTLYAPGGTVFTNGLANDTDEITINAQYFYGTTDYTANTKAQFLWQKYESGEWVTVKAEATGANGNTLTVHAADVVGSASYRCRARYNSGSVYCYDTITIIDKTDNYQADIDSTAGDVFKNTVGQTCLICRLWQNGAEVDPLKSTTYSTTAPSSPAAGDFYYKIASNSPTTALMRYSGSAWVDVTDDADYKHEKTYTWYRRDKDGNPMDSGNAFATGKVIYVDGDDVTVKTVFVCEVE